MAPISRVMAASFGKMPTTLVRRLISPLRRSIGLVECSRRAVFLGEGHVGQHVGLGLVHEVGQLGRLGAELIGHLAPLGRGGLGVLLGKGGGDEGRHHAPAGLTGMGQEVAHEVYDRQRCQVAFKTLHGGGGLDGLHGHRRSPLDASASRAWSGRAGTRSRRLGLRGADGHAQDLTPALVVDRHGDDHGDRDNAPGLAHLHIGGVEPEIASRASKGRSRKSWILPSISPQSRDTWLLEIPRHAHGL